ncbi:sigma 54-interacting transcriptional regulator [Clostridiaceae bacterium M8S5]|nr:sigma 54-interacting transcriptional regulator [Clostridiaceae bacterium M8S5]
MNLDVIYKTIKELCRLQFSNNGNILGVTTNELAKLLQLQRSNVSRELSKLYNDNKIKKKQGKPVMYYVDDTIKESNEEKCIFKSVIGYNGSLKHQVSLAKAAIVYPPKGLHTLILGETGVGKSFFAQCMFKYAVETNRIKNNKFIVFNCADYANNPHLLISHIFGVKKGAYTGADEDKTGIIEKARNGILFLDEVHRLQAEGQEMLFTLIDKGKYTPLGSTSEIPIELMIICATTENINASLLRTFTRRIPVIINLPTLSDRGNDERLKIIKTFIEEEAKRIKKEISIDEQVLSAMMNYDCKNNIGQLKSDIQITCAKAFLRSIGEDNTVRLMLTDLNEEARNGILKTKKIIPNNWGIKSDDLLAINKIERLEDKYNVSQNIYDFIENRCSELSKKGYDNESIKNRLTYELEDFINIYLKNVNTNHDDSEIKNLVNSKLYEMLKNYMILAEYKLKKTISKKVFLGLLIHINIFLNKKRVEVVNPKIDEIRKKYSQEFKVAIKLAEKIEELFEIDVPLGEIGLITMFFAGERIKEKNKVAILVAMHGETTASSMAKVANNLLGVNHVKAYDMNLNIKPQTALKEVEELIKKTDEGMGTILIVDMGSLCYFGRIIEQRTRIKVKTLDMASTPTVIEASRKALNYCSLDEIIESIHKDKKYLSKIFNNPVQYKKDVIVTACLTGEGTALKLKELLEQKYGLDKYEIINLSIEDKENFKIIIKDLQRKNNIKFIVSAFNPHIEGIQYISIQDLFAEFYGSDFLIDNKDDRVNRIKNVFSEYMNISNSEYVVDSFMEILLYMRDTFNIQLDDEKFNGLMMHYGSLIEKLKNKENTPECKKFSFIINRYEQNFNALKNKLVQIDSKIGVEFKDKDIANLVEIIFEV